ncbi:hypothetical protein QBC44DRAFT_89557 [Cladorrhinum sp. PSN332]|nr:hypothetical protein QBC44DRAFT_89557 [Cladorrhinum sp. PSN332]
MRQTHGVHTHHNVSVFFLTLFCFVRGGKKRKDRPFKKYISISLFCLFFFSVLLGGLAGIQRATTVTSSNDHQSHHHRQATSSESLFYNFLFRGFNLPYCCLALLRCSIIQPLFLLLSLPLPIMAMVFFEPIGVSLWCPFVLKFFFSLMRCECWLVGDRLEER